MFYVSDSSTRDGESPSHGRGDGIEPSVWVTRTRRDTLKGIFGMGTGVAPFGNAGLGIRIHRRNDRVRICVSRWRPFSPNGSVPASSRPNTSSSCSWIGLSDAMTTSTRAWPSRRIALVKRLARPTGRSSGGRISARCTAFRSRTRTPTRSRGCDTPTARFCSRIASPRRTSKRAYRGSSTRGRSSSAP